MRTHNRQSVSETRRRRAFTLVEMLVAATLILLMMTLFGQIFGLATNSMNLQRAIAENDQQIRTLTTVLRGDLQKRTFRNVVPFFPLESQDDPSTPFQGREGYFYLSLNSVGNSVDNVLQFTVRATIVDELIDDTPYYGSAITLGGAGAFLANQNQPEHDDGEINPNGAGSSAAAEVCYFVRGGNLYRRQMLLREPLPASGADTEQPTRNDDIDFFAPNTPAGSNPLYTSTQFWEHFDYSSVLRFRGAGHPSGAGPDGAGFIGLESLSNETELPPVATPPAPLLQQIPLRGGATPLGQSRYRFGFDPFTGLSREFGDGATPGDAAGTFFIGRFSHEESSSTDFTYPHIFPGSPTPVGTGNPMDTVGTPLTDNGEGRVSEFAGGTRIGEDLLLTNVHEFRIDVWDQRLGAFVAPGHSLTNAAGEAGDYNAVRRLGVPGSDNRPTTSFYAPIGGTGAVVDTWHPNYDFDNGDGNFYDTANADGTGPDNPPFRPMTWDPIGVCAPVPVNSGPSAIWDYTGGTTYVPGDVVFPPTEDFNVSDPTNTNNLNGILDAGEDGSLPAGLTVNNPGQLDTSGTVAGHGRVYYYVCLQQGVDSGGSAVPSTIQPSWGSTPGQLIRTSDGYIWQVQSNLRPLSAIRITVRFLHRRSGKMRQMTLIHPLVK